VTTAPDGSPIPVYLRIPPFGEAEIVERAVPRGGEVLELGCGVGRITRELVARGYRVVAVDESGAMLRHVMNAETVLARIEDLDLGRTFDCVLLASHLVNADDDAQRRAFLRACARHVRRHGVVLIERHLPAWRPEAGVRSRIGDVTVALEDVEVDPPIVSATVRYDVDGETWRHPFVARILDDAELDDELRAAGLERTGVLDERGAWVAARLRRIVAA
jgi:SAM-dependent methyltransferase